MNKPARERIMNNKTPTPQLSDCCKAEINLTGEPRPEAFDCSNCGRIIGTPLPPQLSKDEEQKFDEMFIHKGEDCDDPPEEWAWNIRGSFPEEIKQFIAESNQRAVEREKKSWCYPFDGLEIKLMYRDGDKVSQNRYIFSLEQIKFIGELSEVAQLKFSYMLKDLLAESLSRKETQ